MTSASAVPRDASTRAPHRAAGCIAGVSSPSGDRAGATDQAPARDLKHELKGWEATFQATQGRAPTKSDLLQHPDIAHKYREYSRLKRSPGAGQRHTSPADAPAVTAEDRALLPLATSILTMSLKRKTASGRRSVPEPSLPEPPLPPQALLRGARWSPGQQRPASDSVRPKHAACETGDAVEATPKRQRIGVLSTPQSTVTLLQAKVHLAGSLVAGPASSEVEAGSVACDAVAYTPPPSLIRQYNQRAPGSSAQVREASPAILPVPGSAPAAPAAGSARAIDLAACTPLLQARAGRLVKTTSIPLSAFGACPLGASQLLPAQGHLSDGNEDGRPGVAASGRLGDLDDGDLVFCAVDEGDDASGPGGGEGAGPSQPKAAKKATQKRSTRRVKLRPVVEGSQASRSTRAAAAGQPHQLVSNNFYKLKLKSGRRGARSAEDRRSALYKRMVATKQRASSRALAPGGGACAREAPGQRPAVNDVCSGDDCGSGLGSSGPDSDDPCSTAEDAGPQRYMVLGRPLADFAANEQASSANELCPLSLGRAAGSGLASCREIVLDLRKVLQHVWGLGQFRPGQAEAIRRVVGGRSTLVSLATGAGKSLVYQLASVVLAAAHGGITLVIMPLLSLMRDQVRQLPAGLQAVCMSSESQGQDTYGKAAARLASGQVHLLFVSPERLQSPRFQAMMSAEGMPRVQLVVADEAHCADEWSHNFRPAYLQLPRLLRSLSATCVLAMTGTATAALGERLCGMFDIDASCGVVRGSVLRRNIELSVVQVEVGARPLARSTAREDALVNVLKSPGMARLDSVIVYVSTQATADRVAEYLTVRSIPAQSYHAGKPAGERARIQSAFMQAASASAAPGGGVPIRVLVATVAFGMGLNKSDVRAVVHFNLPRGMEAYVQEIGRAGRDGAPARGILLLATYPRPASASATRQQQPETWASADAVQLRSWAHVAGVDRTSVRRLLQRLFPASFIRTAVTTAAQARARAAPCESGNWRVSHTAVLEHQSLETETDTDHSTAQTLIGYLALAEPGMFRIEPDAHRRCMIRFTRSDLASLAGAHRLFASIAECAAGGETLAAGGEAPAAQPRRRGIVYNMPGGRKPASSATVDVFELARRMGAEPSDVIAELHQWRAKREVALEWQDPSHVVKVSLDTSRFAGDIASLAGPAGGGGSSSGDAGQWGEQLARRVDDYISALAESASQQNAARVRDSLHRVDSVEATMLAACRAGQETGLASVTQDDLLHASIEAYFAPTQADRESAVRRLREQAGGECERALDDATLAGLFGGPAAAAHADLDAAWPEARARVAGFVQQHADRLTSARVVARVFHGLSGPNCTSSEWMWCPEWGSLVVADFEAVRQCAQEELVKLRCGPTDAAL